ncbi:MAG TPA: CRTAC1 family protein [Planctomycetota bacterium]|nr:CRTAC1 family protein [Planctomycetota bacterium]
MCRRPPAALLLSACLGLAACGGSARPLFERVECGAEIALESGARGADQTLLDLHGNGLALLDVDGDGDLDLLLVDGSTRERVATKRQVSHHLLINTGVRDGAPRFESVPGATGLRMNGWPTGVAVGDVDRDGRPDVLIGGFGEDALFLNRTPAGGAPRFERRELPGHLSTRDWTTSVALADADGDGDLDAYLARYVDLDPAAPPRALPDGAPCTWKGHDVPCGPAGLPPQLDVLLLGDGAGNFIDASDTSGIRAVPPAATLGVLFADLNDDGWPDLYLANDAQPDALLVNQGNGTFADKSALGGDATAAAFAHAGPSVDLGDFDRDGDFDLVLGGFPDEGLGLFREDGGLLFREAGAGAGLTETSRPMLAWGLHLADFDADGWEDIASSNGHVYMQADLPDTGTSWRQRSQLFRGERGGRFAGDSFPENARWAGRASARGDLDGDGDLDLVVLTLDASPRVYVNRTDAPQRQMLIRLQDPVGTPLGATLRLRLDDGPRVSQVLSSRGFQAASDARLHVAGTGPVRSAEVRWNGGAREVLDASALAFGRQIVLRRGLGVVSSRPLVAAPEP